LRQPWERQDSAAVAFIGTLAMGVQARYPANDQESHNSFVYSGLARMRIALYEPDIPQNTGTILRLCACLGIDAHIVEPAGFPVTDRAFRRAGMDYLDRVAITRHGSFQAFEDWRRATRLQLVLLTTAAETSYLDHAFRDDQVVLFGRESAGVPEAVHAAADARLRIPLRAGLRSLNVAMAVALLAGEALRQTGGFGR